MAINQQIFSSGSGSDEKKVGLNQEDILSNHSTAHEGIAEVFREGQDVNFRTVGWIWASIIFLKSMSPVHFPSQSLLTVYLFSQSCLQLEFYPSR
jgi:hypothetical protein